MKIKNALFFIVSCLVTQSSLFAAYAKILNKSLKNQVVSIYTGGQRVDTVTIFFGGEREVWSCPETIKWCKPDKGFSGLTWKELSGRIKPEYTTEYSAKMVSLPNMLNGLIILKPDGVCEINFDGTCESCPEGTRKIETVAKQIKTE